MTSQGRRDTNRNETDDLSPEMAERVSQFSRFLESRRVETHDEPFRGFNSPPGRF